MFGERHGMFPHRCGSPGHGQTILDCRSAEKFWELKESWSLLKDLKGTWRLVKAIRQVLRTDSLVLPPPVLSKGVHADVKAFRRGIKKGIWKAEERDGMSKAVYGRYAEIMNYVEMASGEFSSPYRLK